MTEQHPRDPELPPSWVVTKTGELRCNLTPAELAAAAADEESQLWVDVDVANRHHVAVLEHVFHFHPLAIEDALNPQSRVKLEEYPGYIFMIVRGVRFHEETEDPYDLETFNLDFFLGANYVVTVHAGPSEAVSGVAERIARNPELLGRGAERVMHSVMDASVDAYFPVLDQLDEFVDGLEERVFGTFDRAALRDIFAVKRLVLALRRHLGPQREVFNILTNRPSPLLSPESQVYFRDIYDHVLRIVDSLETYRELLSSTLDSYLTQVSNQLGVITKGLAVIGTVTLPFVVISGMWGMNVNHIPLSGHPHAFWIMLALQAGIGIMMLVILRLMRLL